ncbi:MAG: glycosyltransferase [Bacillota bacterium]
MKISIIIPTYNDELYVDECMNSVVGQSYEDIEVIVIVDGATDGTYEKVKKYEIDKRVQVHYQENTGSGPARNNGLAKATGEYVIFADADDWLPLDAVEMFVEEIGKYQYDVIEGRGISITSIKDYCKEECSKKNVLQSNITEETRRILIRRSMRAAWGRMYRREMLISNGIKFPAIFRNQDAVFNASVFQYCNSLTIIDAVVYLYRDPNLQTKINGRKLEERFLKAQNDIFNNRMRIRDDLFNKAIAVGYHLSEDDMKYFYESELNWFINIIKIKIKMNERDIYKVVKEGISVDKFLSQAIDNKNSTTKFEVLFNRCMQKRQYRRGVFLLRVKILISRVKSKMCK